MGDGARSTDAAQPSGGEPRSDAAASRVDSGASRVDSGAPHMDSGASRADSGASFDASDGAGLNCAPRERILDRACACPAEDVLCPTGGYAHFTVSNAAGSGLPNEASYAVSEELIEDAVTGLVWQRFAASQPMGFAEATDHCAALVAGDRDDFRVPGRIELVTLLDFEELPVAPSVFEDVIADYHWTSSPASFVEGSAYTVYFGAGEVTIASADPGLALVRCVAGRVEEEPSVRFETRGALVADTVTGLQWEAVAGAKATWENATTRCAELGMRLPSLRELESLVDETRYDPALDLALFGGESFELTWTSSTRGTAPWTVDFTDGKTYANVSPRDELESRCVSR